MLILGLSYDIDAAAALVRDGEVVAGCAEERFTRVKHDRSFPDQATRFCLRWGGIRMEDLDWAAMGWNPAIHLQPLLWRQTTRVRHHSEYLAAVPNLLFQAYDERPMGRVTEQTFHFADQRPPLRVAYVEHHLCHAAWAFVSPFERAAVMTVDGFGEQVSTMLATFDGDAITPLAQTRRPHSLGSLYAAITQYLGFRPNQDEGTVMSLAAMAEPRFVDEFRQLVRLTDQDTVELDLTYFAFFQEGLSRVSDKFVARFGPQRQHGDEIEEQHCAVAASMQLVFEERYMELLRRLQRDSGMRQLVVAGGVALNCVANGRILQQTDFEDVFIPPASGDDGASAGAALYLHHQHLGNPRAGKVFTRAGLGPDCVDAEVEELLTISARRFRKLQPTQTPKVAARLLASGRIAGWFQGRSEFGPRALGNRSIVASPGSMEIKDQLNNTIKFRLPFRPFAPSMLAERVGDLFVGGVASPFMLLAFTVKPDWAERVAGILHTDGTARVQTVTADENPRYHALIEHFDRLTGLPIILNTSLNVRGEPIANTPKDALACFDTTAMDYLFLGDYVVCKSDRVAELDAAMADQEQ